LSNLSAWSPWVRLGGSLIVACVGVVLLLRPASAQRIDTHTTGQSVLSGVAATALNPTLFASWSVVVALLSARGHKWAGAAPAAALGLGVSLGSFAWLGAVAWMARHLPRLRQHRRRVVRCLGGLMAFVGLWMCGRAVVALW
jgi:arginine exporter protein ArgO